MRGFCWPVAMTMLFALGCGGARPPVTGGTTPRPAQPAAKQPPPPPPGGPTIAEVRRALDLALARRGGWEGLRLFTECRREAGLEAIEIYGNGVAIWHEKRQFEVDPARITAILEAFRETGFAAMPVQFGGKGGTVAPPLPGDESGVFATAVLCRVELSFAGVTKQVVQLEKGEQSAELRKLAAAFFEQCEEPARVGVEASGLADGLKKIARGELAPESLRLMLHYRPDTTPGGGDAPGFRLRVHGLAVTSREFLPESGYGEERRLTLAPLELEGLARELAAGNPEELPANLWAEDYTDFTLQVLNRKTSIQARQFAGLDRATHGQRQRDFESIFELLSALEARLAGDG